MKEISSKDHDIGICRCRRRSQVDFMNKEVKGYISSSKQQEDSPKITNTKEEIRLEWMKRKVKIAALNWDYFVLQEQLKSLMYIDRSLRGDPKKDKLIDSCIFKNCVRL